MMTIEQIEDSIATDAVFGAQTLYGVVLHQVGLELIRQSKTVSEDCVGQPVESQVRDFLSVIQDHLDSLDWAQDLITHFCKRGAAVHGFARVDRKLVEREVTREIRGLVEKWRKEKR